MLMKAIPIITALLICQITFLAHVIRKLAWLHHKPFKISEFNPQKIPGDDRWFQLAISSCLGLMLLSLALIVVIWKTRLCERWALIGILLLWLIMFFGTLPSGIH